MPDKLLSQWVKKSLGLHAAERPTHYSARSRRAAAAPLLEGLEDRALLSTFWVTNTGDNGGVNPVPGASTGTLRQAIVDADAAAAGTAAHPDQIDFNIPSTDPGYLTSSRSFLIMPTTALPVITDAVVLDGTSEPGFIGTPKIVVNGGLASNANGLDITAGNSTIEGLVIQQFQRYGLVLETNGGDSVTGNFIGTDITGALASGNGAGILVTSASNIIGGTTAATKNVISGNTGAGIQITGAGAAKNLVIGNEIGTDITGTRPLGNGGSGVVIDQAANNTIGGTYLADNFDVSHNYSGGNVAGTGWDGVLNPDNLLSGDADITATATATWAATANSGWENNLDNGPMLYKMVTGDFDVSVHVKSITTDLWSDGGLIARVPGATGSTENYVALRYFGVGGFNATRNTVNSSTTNNNYPGFEPYLRITRTGTTFKFFTKAKSTDPWTLRDTVARSDIPVGSPMQVGLWFGTFLTGNLGRIQFNHFRLSAAGEANTIADNTRDGVAVTGNTATGNAIMSNSIHDNGVLGIDLGADGVTPNDALGHTGPNNFQSFPDLKSAAGNARTTTVTGTFGSRNLSGSSYQPNTVVTLEFYASTSPGRSGKYGGQTYLGSFRVRTDGNGYAAFTTPKGVLAAAPAGVRYVMATATGPGGSTSEFSAGLPVAHHNRGPSRPRRQWSTLPGQRPGKRQH
jgi:hypothetical protein